MKQRVNNYWPIIPLVTLIIVAGCTTAPEPPVEVAVAEPLPEIPEQDPYESISLAMAIGDIEAAIAAFEEAYSKNPDDPETKALYAKLLIAGGKVDEARTVLQEILDADPENTDALYNLALLAGADGDRDKKRELLERTIAADPEDSAKAAEAHAALGEMHLEDRKLKKAKASFEQGIASDPENLVSRIGMGNVLLREDKAKEALEHFDKAIEIEPDYDFAYVDRSRAKMDTNDMRGSEADLTTAIELNEDYYWNYVDRGRVRLFGIGDSNGALEDFSTAIDLRPDYFYAYVFRGGIYDRKEMIDEAVADYKTVLNMRPDYYHAYAPVGVLLYMQQDWVQAERYFRLAYEANPEDYGLPIMAATCMRWDGRDKDAKKYVESIITKIPRDTLYWHMGRLYMEHGYDGYMTSLINDEKDEVTQTRMLFYLATHYLLTGRDRIALTYYLAVTDVKRPDIFEIRLAEKEIQKRQSN